MNKQEELDKYSKLIESSECDKQKAQYYVEKGKTHQSMGNTILAIDDFNYAIGLDSDNKEAKSYLEHLYSILDYRYVHFYDV